MRFHSIKTLAAAALLVSGCGQSGGDAQPVAADSPAQPPEVTFTPADDTSATAKVSGPVSIAYRIIGQPVVGQPLAIDLAVTSSLGRQPVRLDYRVVDTSALRLGDAQTAFATIAASSAEVTTGEQQVTVVPMREGRLYLNIAATVETPEGSMSTVTAIPIQVGDLRREPVSNGVLATDEDGNAVRVLSGEER